MKRYFFVGLFILLLFPCMVNAKEYCKVVSGDGKSVGTELKCGTEHFYIVENENNTIRMLAKYNLLVGDKIDNIVIDINDYKIIKFQRKIDGLIGILSFTLLFLFGIALIVNSSVISFNYTKMFVGISIIFFYIYLSLDFQISNILVEILI